MKIKERDTFIDILKGIGIVSIVIGHSSWILPKTQFPIGPFVYTYHIMIFFFVVGMCFKPRIDITPFQLIGKRLESLLPLYVKYSICFIIAHNLLRRIHVLSPNSVLYGKTDIINHIINACVLTGSEQMLGAFWFIPMFMVGVAFFIVLFYQAEKYKISRVIHVCVGVLTALVGIWLNYRQSDLQYHIQTSMLGIGVIYLGYLFQKYRTEIMRYLRWWMAGLFGVCIWGILLLNIGIIELSVNQIIHPLLFYPVTIIGILFCICVAQGLEKVNGLKCVFSIFGKNSYHIMALHFLVFKLIDLCYGKLICADTNTISQYPYAFGNLWPIYYICGVTIPVLVIYILKKGLGMIPNIGIKSKSNSGSKM